MSDISEVQDTQYQRAYAQARRQVRRIRGWYLHAFIFTVIVGYAWLRYLFGPSLVDWGAYHYLPRMPLKMTLGWGFALFVHGLVVWGRFGPLGRDWETKQIKRIMDQDRGSSSPSGANQDQGKP